MQRQHIPHRQLRSPIRRPAESKRVLDLEDAESPDVALRTRRLWVEKKKKVNLT
jgi:hypothetical protein